ncbi:HAD-IIB family hydrolase [Antarctobacter jejuensis]|uniref:HAD-IIB family hydrolase n=1 Tax=Antarctobacter jejuensis TaxID=1439938 RepID=UPI003FD613C1
MKNKGSNVTDLVVFSDLDGTLLDHDSYSFEAAKPALQALAKHHIPLVLATSKTAAEVAVLHKQMGLGSAPAIVENGAGLFRPGDQVQDESAYYALRKALEDLPAELRGSFAGFGDMSGEEIARITGLAPEAAALARCRQHSEPGIWTGSDEGRAAFLAALKEAGISARSGGRFLTLSHGRTKADGMRRIAGEYQARLTLALGDAPNDIELLQTADIGVVVRNDYGPGVPRLPGEATGAIRRTTQPGPAGWAEAVLAILQEIN